MLGLCNNCFYLPDQSLESLLVIIYDIYNNIYGDMCIIIPYKGVSAVEKDARKELSKEKME